MGKAKDAVAVIAYHRLSRKSWVVLEAEYDTSTDDKVDHIEAFATILRATYEKYTIEGQTPLAIAFDTGGVGERIASLMSYRYNVPGIIAAKKSNKMTWIEVLRSELYSGRLSLKEDSLFLSEVDQIIYTERRKEIDDEQGLHSDIMDAVLYAMRHLHNLHPEVKEKPKTEEEKIFEKIKKEHMEGMKRNSGWDSDNL